jgi:glycine cleavage system H protein
MSNIPNDLLYTKEHEWVKVEGDRATIGITDHAQAELGDIVFVELPKVGAELAQGKEFGVVESVKTVSNLYSPISGKVLEVNTELDTSAELVNKDPYNQGWIIKADNIEPAELETLLSAEDYQKIIEA